MLFLLVVMQYLEFLPFFSFLSFQTNYSGQQSTIHMSGKKSLNGYASHAQSYFVEDKI